MEAPERQRPRADRMAVQTRVKPAAKSDAAKLEKHAGLSRDTLIRLYRTMYLSRKLDDRQMPSHWGHAKYNIVSKSSCTGTQFVHAVGAAEATLYYQAHPKALAQAKKAPLGDLARHTADEIVYVSSGDGATSEGEFWESLNAACAKKLPLLYLVEDNGYAISVPVEVQTAGGSISKLVQGFPDLHIAECDGTDPIESYSVCKEAVKYCRGQPG